ncbi:MAG: Lrp/AsnC ligand binding domain-containing protein [Candidatus Omnitrophota bacterium]|nr:Lrp/AsnC ligand binding domain-containing protein [Candidatus Omnitrophota bacterium]
MSRSKKLQGKIRLSLLDKRILNRLQEDIPFESGPWAAVAGELNIKEDLLLKRVAFFKKTGIIRRISAVFSPRKINFISTLVAVKALPGNAGRVAKKINSYPEVTHNYRRGGPYDLWFTVVAGNKDRIAHIMRRLEKDKDIERLSEFPAVKLFKINVKFTA